MLCKTIKQLLEIAQINTITLRIFSEIYLPEKQKWSCKLRRDTIDIKVK